MFDDVTVEELRSGGSVKWSTFPNALGAFIAEMDFGTAPAVSQAIHKAVDSHQFGYLPEWVKTDLGSAYTRFAKNRYGVRVNPEMVRPIVDVVEALIAVITHFTPPDSPIIVPTPAYMPFLTLGEVVGRRIIQVPMDYDGERYVYNLDRLAQAFTQPGQLLVLCNPHNPIGRVLTQAELEEISQVVDAHGGLVFSDEIHAPITYHPHRHIPYALINDVARGHTITATSISKAWNVPGLKAAQIIFSNPDHYQTWKSFGRRYEQMASTVGVLAAIAAYSEGSTWLDSVLGYLDHNRTTLGKLLGQHLPQVGYQPPEGTFLAWLDARSLGLPGPGADFFRQHAGVALTSGEDCGAEGFLRLNFATPTPILTEAIKLMADSVFHR